MPLILLQYINSTIPLQVALELVSVILLQTIIHYGWFTVPSVIMCNTFSSRHQSGKFPLLSIAMNACRPEVPYFEVLLDDIQLSTIIEHLKMICSPESEIHVKGLQLYSAREILLITKAVTRIPANSSALTEYGLEELLDRLMKSSDENTKIMVASILSELPTIKRCVNSEVVGVATLTDIGKNELAQ